MQGTIAKCAADCSLASPLSARGDCELSRNIVFVIVDVESQRASDMVVDDFTQRPFAIH